MSNNLVIIPAKAVSHLKKKAKLLHRKSGIAHHVVLDQIAVGAGFQNWHHLSVAAKETEPIEQRFQTGLFFMMDVKEGVESLDDNLEVTLDPLIFRQAELIKWFRANPEFRNDTVAEIRELVDENFIFLRYLGAPVEDRAKAEVLLRKLFFWTPQLVWLNGRCFDPDSSGDQESYFVEFDPHGEGLSELRD